MNLVEVLIEAVDTRGFMSFLTLAGLKIQVGDTLPVQKALEGVGVPGPIAWDIVESWGRRRGAEAATGWTPELASASSIMHSLEGWRTVDWVEAMIRMVSDSRKTGSRS